MGRLIIAVSGTPGTGKSVFAKVLAKKLNAELIDLNNLITEKKIYRLDKSGVKVANLQKMNKEFTQIVKTSKNSIVVEGLLAHLLPKKLITHVVILRTRPKILEKRLRARNYSDSKIRENVEAEALDIILWEAVNVHGVDKVFEIDTTKVKPEAAVSLFLEALEGKISLRPGKISWLEEVF